MRQKLHDIGQQRDRLKLSDTDEMAENLMKRQKNLDMDKVSQRTIWFTNRRACML